MALPGNYWNAVFISKSGCANIGCLSFTSQIKTSYENSGNAANYQRKPNLVGTPL